MSTALPIFLFVAISCFMAVTIIIVAHVIGPKARPTAVKLMPYESGMDPFHSARQRFSISFYLLAIEFLVFDVELLFLYPWAVSVGGNNPQALGRMPGEQGVFWAVMAFVTVLMVGFVYTWKKGVFKWN
jgi:NADH-quinone oxidoreductase subunit A